MVNPQHPPFLKKMEKLIFIIVRNKVQSIHQRSWSYEIDRICYVVCLNYIRIVCPNCYLNLIFCSVYFLSRKLHIWYVSNDIHCHNCIKYRFFTVVSNPFSSALIRRIILVTLFSNKSLEITTNINYVWPQLVRM